MKTIITLAVVCMLMAVDSASAFSLQGARNRLSFLKRAAPKSSVTNTPTAERTQDTQTLDEFNAFCQQVIAEERQQHYYAFVNECSSPHRRRA